MSPDEGKSGDLSRTYLMVVVCETAVIIALYLFERVFR
jgi:hypothetical protein